MLRKPISAPRCFGSFATSIIVAALHRNNKSYMMAWLAWQSGISSCGSVKRHESKARREHLAHGRRAIVARLRLALGTVPVSAGVIGDGLMAASGTGIDMAAQRRRPATGDRPQDSQMLEAQPPLILIYEAVIVRAKDVGHLHGRPVHSGLKRLRGRGTFAVPKIWMRSSGFGADCRCFCETCRYRAVCAMSA